MRVLTYLHSFGPGGVERVALRLVRAWRELSVDAPLFMGRSDGAMRAERAYDLAYEVPRQPRFSIAWMEALWMILSLPRAITRLRPDILFCAGNSYTVVAAALKFLLGEHCPPIVATRCSAGLAALGDQRRLVQLVAPGDVQDLAQGIRDAGSAVQDPTMSLRIARRFTIEQASRTYLACFDETFRPSLRRSTSSKASTRQRSL